MEETTQAECYRLNFNVLKVVIVIYLHDNHLFICAVLILLYYLRGVVMQFCQMID